MVTLNKYIWQSVHLWLHGRSMQIMSPMLDLARLLKPPIIVEGIETDVQAKLLRQMSTRFVQGFFYHRPMSVKGFETLLDSGEGN